MIVLRQAQNERVGGVGLAERLAEKARRIAETQVARRSHGPRRWRIARLLWPLFASRAQGER